MKNNTISVNVNYVNGTAQTILDEDSPNEALEKYLFPDSGMPITFSIRVKSNDGREVSIVIDKAKNEVFVSID